MAKALRSKDRYEVFSFRVKDTFPHDNPLAVDLVRLMAAYNDMSEVIEWMNAHGSGTTKPVAVMKSRVRNGIQHRLLLALMHETFLVFGNIQSSPEFKKVVDLLDPKGKAALTQLRQSAGREKASVRSSLSMARNTVTFHYDRDSFSEGLRRLPRIFLEAEKVESKMLLRHNGRAFYMLPEEVRGIIAYDFKTISDGPNMAQNLGAFLADVARLQGELFTFIDEMLKSYVALKGLRDSFKHSVVYE